MGGSTSGVQKPGGDPSAAGRCLSPAPVPAAMSLEDIDPPAPPELPEMDADAYEDVEVQFRRRGRVDVLQAHGRRYGSGG